MLFALDISPWVFPMAGFLFLLGKETSSVFFYFCRVPPFFSQLTIMKQFLFNFK